MKDCVFWRVVSVGGVLALFAIGFGLGKNGQVPSPSVASAAYAADAAIEKPEVVLEILPTSAPSMDLRRARVPGGWLVFTQWHSADMVMPSHGTTVFYPDPSHTWDVRILPMGAKHSGLPAAAR
jgi:hypothetical protein